MNRRIGSVRAKLLFALGFLALSTLAAALVGWIALKDAEIRLRQLNEVTLSKVESALRLSETASTLSTTAPYILAAKSPFRITQQAEAARRLAKTLRPDLPDEARVEIAAVEQLLVAIGKLEQAAVAKAALEDRILRINAEVASLERRLSAFSASPDVPIVLRQEWLSLQRMATNLLGAGRAENLIGVGEFQRAYHDIVLRMEGSSQIVGRREFLALAGMANGIDGLFELRRRELSAALSSERELNSIRSATDVILAYSRSVTASAQDAIASENSRSAGAIGFARTFTMVAVIVSALIALATSYFVSTYLSRNLVGVANAMTRLAEGDRSAKLPSARGEGDEITALFQAFRVFRANALRLDRNNRKLAQRNGLLEAIFEGMSDGVAVVGANGLITASNEAFRRYLSVPSDQSLANTDLAGLLEIGAWDKQTVEGLGIQRLTSPSEQKLEMRSAPLSDGGAVVLLSDTTERDALDERLEDLRHIEGLGKITGEVAHDFGNILSRLAVNADLLKSDNPEIRKRALNAFTSAVEHGSSLTQRLLAFAKRQRLAPETIDLNDLVLGMEDLIALALPDTVTLKIQVSETALPLHVDAGQLEAAILNLCVNSGQAVDARGEIVIRTIRGDYNKAIVSVSDNGRGMTEAVRRRAMEPFFSARPDGRGTGLGLAMVYGFARQSQGDVVITSVPGAGTKVELMFPLRNEVASGPAARCVGTGTVLVIDDNADELEYMARVLEANGFRAETFSDVTAALGAIEHPGNQYSWVVTDLEIQSRQDGFDIARHALAANTSTLVAIVSGRLPNSHPDDLAASGRVVFAEKPFSIDLLSELDDMVQTRTDLPDPAKS